MSNTVFSIVVFGNSITADYSAAYGFNAVSTPFSTFMFSI